MWGCRFWFKKKRAEERGRGDGGAEGCDCEMEGVRVKGGVEGREEGGEKGGGGGKERGGGGHGARTRRSKIIEHSVVGATPVGFSTPGPQSMFFSAFLTYRNFRRTVTKRQYRKVKTSFFWQLQIRPDGPAGRPSVGQSGRPPQEPSHNEHDCGTAHTYRRASRSRFAVRPGPYHTRAHTHARHTALPVAGGALLGCMLKHAGSGGAHAACAYVESELVYADTHS